MYENVNKVDMQIMEGTTHYINIDCIDKLTREPYDLTGHKATFSIKKENTAVHKKTEIHDYTVSAKIEPEDSVGIKRIPYECRIFSPNGDVYHVVYGVIEIVKAPVLLTKYPDEND